MRIATFNMRGCKSLGHWTRALDATQADVFFAQESKHPNHFSGDLYSDRDLSSTRWVLAPDRAWGSAVYSKWGALSPVEIPGFTGWAVGGHLSLPNLEVAAFSVHIPKSDGPTYTAVAGRLLDEIRSVTSGLPLILAGDWNLTVGSHVATDVRPTSPSDLKLLARLQDEFGLVSAWRALHKEASLPQTLRWAAEPEHPYHCDGIFVPSDWVPKLVSAEVLGGEEWHELSDHNPVVVEIEGLGEPRV